MVRAGGRATLPTSALAWGKPFAGIEKMAAERAFPDAAGGPKRTSGYRHIHDEPFMPGDQ
jgi:hypothetical protein